MNAMRNVLVAAALAALAPAALAQTFEMKLGFATINDSQHEVAKLFAAEMDRKTNGAVQVKIFPAAQLGSRKTIGVPARMSSRSAPIVCRSSDFAVSSMP